MRNIFEKIPFPILSILGAVCCLLAWPPYPLFFLIFIAFVPLLYMEHRVSLEREKPSKFKVWRHAMLFFLLWNLLVTWWVKNASLPGFVMALFLNSLFMSIPFVLFHQTKKKLGTYIGYLSFIFYWLSFEYLHMNWDLTWSWLNIGNVLAMYPSLMQWYEFTGSLGGTMWILEVNVLILLLLIPEKPSFNYKKIAQTLALFITLPILISVVQYYTYQAQGEVVEVVALQPNLDPYNEKFVAEKKDEQMENFLRLSQEKLTENTQFLVWPETSVPTRRAIFLTKVNEHERVKQIRRFIQNTYPNLSLVTGIEPIRYYDGLDGSPTARNIPNRIKSYDIHNSAILLDSSQHYQVYHKSKLVPGVERMPFYSVMKHFGIDKMHFIIKLGGIPGTRATQEKRTALFNSDSIGVAPVICYESVYGEYVTGYVQDGAQLIFVVTNDGWWGNTPGHKQHKYYSSIRAIETRRDVVRSANTGISCFVNQRGDISQELAYWTAGAIRGEMHANTFLTIYTRYGDYIARTALLLSFILLLYTVLGQFIKTKLNRD